MIDRTDLASIVDQLDQRRQQWVEQRMRLEEELKAVTVQLGKVNDAISALRNGKAKAKPIKPSPNRDVVRAPTEACPTNQSALRVEALKDSVGMRLMAEGFSRSGLVLRIQELLREETFFESGDGSWQRAF
jgi:hypothetical protein